MLKEAFLIRIEKTEIKSRLEYNVSEARRCLALRDAAQEAELGSLMEFIEQADGCCLVDIWTLEVRHIGLWQCFLALLPWHFGLHRFHELHDVAPPEAGWIFTRRWPLLDK